VSECQRKQLATLLGQHIITEGAYFVMPGGAFKNTEELDTRLGASNKLTIRCEGSGDGATGCKVPTNNSQGNITLSTPGGTHATITDNKVHRDIKAGRSVVHIVDNVLMPTANMTCPPEKSDETHSKDKAATVSTAGTVEPSLSPKASPGTGIHVPGLHRRVLHG
jgi:hypothetical protein